MATFYGHLDWFNKRNITVYDYYERENNETDLVKVYDNDMIPVRPKKVYDMDELERVGVCMSTVLVDKSQIPHSGVGLYANKAFKRGEIVTISPVFIWPKGRLINESDPDLGMNGFLLNYVLYPGGDFKNPHSNSNTSNIFLFPFAHAASINHEPYRGMANVELEWFLWPQGSDYVEGVTPRKPTPFTPDTPIDTLIRAPFSPLDIAYRATRDIELGEEIYMDYGEEWLTAWRKYVEQVNLYLRRLIIEGDSYENPIPYFRHPIKAPEGMIPSHWVVDEANYDMARAYEYNLNKGHADASKAIASMDKKQRDELLGTLKDGLAELQKLKQAIQNGEPLHDDDEDEDDHTGGGKAAGGVGVGAGAGAGVGVSAGSPPSSASTSNQPKASPTPVPLSVFFKDRPSGGVGGNWKKSQSQSQQDEL